MPTEFRLDLFPMGNIPDTKMASAMRHGVESARREGIMGLRRLRGNEHVRISSTHVLRCQHRRHERLEVILDFSRASCAVGIRAPDLISCGRDSTGTWWVLHNRIMGSDCPGQPTRAAFIQLTEALHALHGAPVSGSCRWGDPGVIGIFLGTVHACEPAAYPRLARHLWELTANVPMGPIHGDVGLRHNSLWDQTGQLVGIIDPGAVSVGPPSVDHAWAVAMGVGDGHDPESLLECVPSDESDLTRALLPLMVRRRLSDARDQGNLDRQEYCESYLKRIGHDGIAWLRG